MQLGTNITATVEGAELVLRIKMDETHGRSASGKSEIIASTQGNKPAPGFPEAKIGLNIYK